MSTVNNLGSLSSLTESTSASAKKSNEEVSKNEFLQLLVTQLKYQDPMDPVKNEDFAVNLAQFSQLEQLVSINGKMQGSSGDLSSLTGYLGREVTLNSDQVHVTAGDGGSARFTLPSNISTGRIELLDYQGRVVESRNLGALTAGKQSVALQGLDAANGDYTARLVATATDGTQIQAAVSAAGIVTGVIPGDEPTLIVAGQEIKTSDIIEVNLAPAAQG